MNISQQQGGRGYLIDWIVRIGDLVLINLFFILAFQIFCSYSIIFAKLFNYRESFLLLSLVNLAYFVTASFVQVHLSSNIIHFDKIISKSFLFIFFYLGLFTVSILIFGFPPISLSIWIICYSLLSFLFVTWHVLCRRVIKRHRRKGYNYRQIVIVGAGINGKKIYADLKESDFGYKILGFFDDDETKKDRQPNYLGKILAIEEFVNNNSKINDLFCTLPGNEEEKILSLIQFCEKNMIRFHLVPESHKYLKRQFVLSFLNTTPVLSLRVEPLQSFTNRSIKRFFDLVFSSIFLVFFFPFLYLLFGVLIKYCSPGPIFFKQKRTGIQGKEFYCYKFRSMTLNSNADNKSATREDPRTTRIGRFMRCTSMDELPQLINVWKGEMSLVGPRPHMLKHTAIYTMLIDKFMVRHLVKPGITGWAQIHGLRGETKVLADMEARVQKDVWYIENWSFWLDVKIILITVISLFRKDDKAY